MAGSTWPQQDMIQAASSPQKRRQHGMLDLGRDAPALRQQRTRLLGHHPGDYGLRGGPVNGGSPTSIS